jgi:STE24 endopeptidase
MLVAGPLGFFAGRLSRGVERRADAVSLELVDDPEAFLAFERRIATQNLADVRPPWWVRQLMATHPSTEERLAMALGYARQGPA